MPYRAGALSVAWNQAEYSQDGCDERFCDHIFLFYGANIKKMLKDASKSQKISIFAQTLTSFMENNIPQGGINST